MMLVSQAATWRLANIGDEPATIRFELLPAANSEEAFARLVTEEIGGAHAFLEAHGTKIAGPPIDYP